ncbi:MAG TPA: MBL fold metallo-hydrolase [Gemmatimonadales bacterium]|nr:MBL fold metallo-hydrolase [Gemmatimonadales bacterium]
MPYFVTFWGTRGSIPTPGAQTNRYGGNTSCVAVSAGGDRLVILDAGSGIRPLGRSLLDAHPNAMTAEILLTHTHWDHIQGLPFFAPLNRAGNTVRIFGPRQGDVALETIIDRQTDATVFPIPIRALAAELTVTEVTPGPFEVDGFRVETCRLRHPGTTLAYRLTPREGGASMAYVTDNELGRGGSYDVPADWRHQLVRFLGDVDLLVHDAMYGDDLIEARAGWGHSSPRQAVELAAECGARRLLLFHHEPEHDDATIDALLDGARAVAARSAPTLRVDAALEGLQLNL